MAKTLGRDGMIGSVVLEGLGYEFRSLTNAEDALVKWTSSTGATQAKLTGAGQLKLYNGPLATADVGTSGYVATYYLPLVGGTLSGPLNLGGWPITNVASATADNEVMTRSASDGRYLKPADAASTYLTSVNATATYLSKADATANYAPKTGSTEYATKTTVEATYLSKTTAATTYAPLSGSSSYAPASGSSNYAPASGSSNYAPKASPSFTGTVTSAGGIDTAGIKSDIVTTLTGPVSTYSAGYAFDSAGTVTAVMTCTPTSLYFLTPNQTSAAVYFLKNTASPYTAVPVYCGSPTNDNHAVTRGYFNSNAAGTSDLRLKKSLVPLDSEEALSLVSQLSAFRYQYLPDGSSSVGLVADDVLSVIPEAVRDLDGFEDYVSEGEPKIRGILPLAVVGVLVEAVKALTARVEALEAKA
jgi:hypothetical protein